MALRDNTAHNRYELRVDDETAALHYRLKPGVITLQHTDVPAELAGRGIGSRLVREVLDDVRARGLKLVAACPFVVAFLGKHPEYNDLLN